MKWHDARKELPTKTGKWYLIAYACQLCLDNKDHAHLACVGYEPFQYGLAHWHSKDLTLVNFYQAQGDHSWDWAAYDHWTGTSPLIKTMTHWMEFHNFPENDDTEISNGMD